MNVYDFDGTLYDGESTLDFYVFCVKRHPKLLKYLILIVFNLIRYKLCLVSFEKFSFLTKKYTPGVIECCPDIEKLSQEFWDKKSYKLKNFYNDVRKDDDVIVTASFGVVIKPALEKLGFSDMQRVVCSELFIESKTVGDLCFGKNKINMFKKRFGQSKVWDFYTDSFNDKPFMSLAGGNVYIVRKNKIQKYMFKKFKNTERNS